MTTKTIPITSNPVSKRDRIASLASQLATRARGWAWWPVYQRWKRGEKLSSFHRKWLALSAKRLAEGGGDRGWDQIAVPCVPLWPQKETK